MRVCILTRGDLFPTNHGAAVKIIRTAEQLSLQMGQPTVIVTDDRDHYLRVEGSRITSVSYPPRVRAAEEWPPLPRLSALADRLCAVVGYPREEHFLYRPVFDPTWWLRALAVGLLEQIDVFQAEFPGYGAPAWVASRGVRALTHRRVQAVLVQHNVEWDRLAAFGHDVRHIRRVEQALLRAMDAVIAVSADDRQRMIAAGLPAERITIIPHGVDAATFSSAAGIGIRERYGLSGGPLLFFHGTLHYWPNTEAVRFIAERLLPRLLQTRPDLRVLIAGMNPPTYYSHPAITFTGAVADLADHIAAADVCICPLFAGGGTRLKLLEYMAAGKATVSTTKGAEGIPYTPGEHLLIADEVEPFAAAVGRLLEDAPLRVRLGQAGARFAARHDWAAVTQGYLRLFAGDRADWRPATAAAGIGDHLPPGRTPSKPLTMLLLINRGCNLRCQFCDLWDNHQHMPLERLLPLLDEAQRIGTRTLVITGGEPLLHPDLFTAIRAARARGMGVNVTTNGTLVERHWDALVASGVDSLSFSIDGGEATHDRLRGQVGAWRRTWRAIGRTRTAGITTSVYFVATRDNVRELVETYTRARASGCGFDFWPVNDAPDLYIRAPEDVEVWRAAVAHIAAREPAVAARQAFYVAGEAYHAGTLPRGAVRCLGLVDQYGVTYEGALLPCCVWGGEGLVVGNVFETPLSVLWRSPAVQRYRENLYGEGCGAGCFNHSLYEFESSTGQPFRV